MEIKSETSYLTFKSGQLQGMCVLARVTSALELAEGVPWSLPWSLRNALELAEGVC